MRNNPMTIKIDRTKGDRREAHEAVAEVARGEVEQIYTRKNADLIVTVYWWNDRGRKSQESHYFRYL